MPEFKNFDPNQYIVSFANIIVQGYVSDTFIEASRNEDAYTEVVGAQGDVIRVRNNNKTGIVTLTLQDVSPTNDAFSTRVAADELTPGGIAAAPLVIKNLNGTTLIFVENAWIRKIADMNVSTEPGPRVWVISCAELEMFVGGAVA
jgi:hypothetical protein